MVYHPEGVIRPTPEEVSNTTDFVYDYFIKDYLGNVRVVLTEEDATLTQKFLATMEEVWAHIEEANFDQISETREQLPDGYPIDGRVDLNEYIAYVFTDNEMKVGPSMMMAVNKDEKMQASVEYFYTEDAPGASYDNLGLMVSEILVSMVSAGAGVLPVSETMLMNVVSGQTNVGSDLFNFLSTQIDTTDLSRPQGYLVYLAYDNQFNLVPSNSGALQVESPNQLENLLSGEITVEKDGYFHIEACPERGQGFCAEGIERVSNGSSEKGISYDNFLITAMKGKTRQTQWVLGEARSPYSHASRPGGAERGGVINHYYPYGLRMAGMDGYTHNYTSAPLSAGKNMYTGKELQTGEFDPSLSTGLEMYDFHARFYDPQLGRWFTPDPAEQFHNPYLAMGNNPVVYVDPDGRLAWFVPVIIGAVAGAYTGGAIAAGDGGLSGANWNPFGGDQGSWQGTDWHKGAITGGIIGAGVGLGFSAGFAKALSIKGLGSTAGGFGATGASSFGWNITSNALITANINIASTAMQGGDWDAVYKSGLVGLGAGAVGGLAGSIKMSGPAGVANGKTTSAFALKASKTQNLVTNVLNGGADRYVKGIDAGLSHRDALNNGLWGAAEGLISASLVNKSNYLDGLGVENVGLAAPGLNRFKGDINYQFFRYASSGISSAITSTPGAGFFAGRTFLSIYAPYNLDPLALMVTPWLNFGRFGLFPGLQRTIVGGNYPYASPFLSPLPGQ